MSEWMGWYNMPGLVKDVLVEVVIVSRQGLMLLELIKSCLRVKGGGTILLEGIKFAEETGLQGTNRR